MSRRSLRLLPRISYYEPEEPNLDEYIFCEKCADYVYEYCSIHGPLLVIPDDKIPSTPTFPTFVPRAALTIPHVFLHLNYSSIPGAGLGVFATLKLPSGVCFGPYVGERAKDIRTEYCWQIYDRNNKPSHVIDASDANKSNWMRYVNCARHWSEQNLAAYQYQGKLYYRTIRIIPRYTELMVFYGSEFANSLNIDLGKYNSPSCYARKFGAPAPKKPVFGVKKNLQQKQCALKPIEQKKESTESSTSQAKEPKTDINRTIQNMDVLKENKSQGTFAESAPKKRKIQVDNKISSPKKNVLKPPKENMNSKVRTRDIRQDASKVTTEVSKKRKTKKITKNTKSKQDPNTSDKGNMKNDLANTTCNDANINCDYTKPIDDKTTTNQNNFDKGNVLPNTESGESYQTSSKIRNEARIRKEDAYFCCDVCDYHTITKDILQKHLKLHDMKRVFACEICGYRFLHNCLLNSHKLKQHGIKTGNVKIHECNICEYTTTNKTNIKNHLLKHAGLKPHLCNKCDYKCSRASNLKKHLRTHTGEKPYLCNKCDYKCSEASSLKKHLRTHTGEKPYLCNKCDYKCSHASSLKTHLRTHTGEKPYLCNKCDYKCSHASSLKTHLRTHTGEKPYLCNKCDYKCSKASSLKTHLRTHTGEKPYLCNKCDYKCSKASSLKTHLRTHTGDKPYSCNICDYKCIQKNHLNNHLKKIHLK